MHSILGILLWPFRAVMSVLIRFFDRAFSPAPMVREPARQAQVDQQTASLALYHMEACPFCVKVRRHVLRLGLNIELRDIKRDAAFLQELLQGGGQDQVPCLRIRVTGQPDQWMYESSDINAYLSSRFAG